MNNEIPTLWLWISGIFFFAGILVFSGTLVLLFKVMKLAEEMKPKVDSLTTKVEGLVVKLDAVADRVDETMISVKTTIDGVGGKANSIVGSVDTFTKVTSGRLEGLAPIISGAMAAYKFFITFKAAREKAKSTPVKKALAKKK